MDTYEQYEQDCSRNREENKILLDEFEKWLADKGLTAKTISKHYSNIDFYINEFLLYEDAIAAAGGANEIGYFFRLLVY